MAPNAPRAAGAKMGARDEQEARRVGSNGSVQPAEDYFAPVRAGLLQVDEEIRRHLATDDPLLHDVSTHLLDGGGKRLRPALVLLAGQACGAPAESLAPEGAAVEIIHMATLVHDDMVDEATVRRGVPTIHAKWGSAVSVLMGDYLFAKGFSILASRGDNRVVRIMSDVVFRMCAGEIRELVEQWDTSLDEAAYLSRVDAKTAYFIAESCRLGAVVGGAPEQVEEALGAYGGAVGLCYQIVDDVLDLVSSPEVLGKPSGSDLRAGVLTLPVLYALEQSPEREILRRTIASRHIGDEDVALCRGILERCGAIEYAQERASALAREAQEALEVLPPSPARTALFGLAEYLIGRSY